MSDVTVCIQAWRGDPKDLHPVLWAAAGNDPARILVNDPRGVIEDEPSTRRLCAALGVELVKFWSEPGAPGAHIGRWRMVEHATHSEWVMLIDEDIMLRHDTIRALEMVTQRDHVAGVHPTIVDISGRTPNVFTTWPINNDQAPRWSGHRRVPLFALGCALVNRKMLMKHVPPGCPAPPGAGGEDLWAAGMLRLGGTLWQISDPVLHLRLDEPGWHPEVVSLEDDWVVPALADAGVYVDTY